MAWGIVYMPRGIEAISATGKEQMRSAYARHIQSLQKKHKDDITQILHNSGGGQRHPNEI